MIYVFRPGTTSLNFFMQSRTLLAWTGSLGTSRCFEATELRSKYSAKISDSVMRAPSPARGSRSERVRNRGARRVVFGRGRGAREEVRAVQRKSARGRVGSRVGPVDLDKACNSANQCRVDMHDATPPHCGDAFSTCFDSTRGHAP